MIEIEESVFVELPPSRVFRFAGRPQNMPRWNPAIRHSRTVGPLREGAEVEQVVDLMGRRFEVVYEVTEYTPSRRLTCTTTQGPVHVEGTMEFERAPGGTVVRWTVRGDTRGFVRVGKRILVGLGRPEMRACLENLKAILEQGNLDQHSRGHQALAPSMAGRSRPRLLGLVASLVSDKH